jgi:hypothetical protein
VDLCAALFKRVSSSAISRLSIYEAWPG